MNATFQQTPGILSRPLLWTFSPDVLYGVIDHFMLKLVKLLIRLKGIFTLWRGRRRLGISDGRSSPPSLALSRPPPACRTAEPRVKLRPPVRRGFDDTPYNTHSPLKTKARRQSPSRILWHPCYSYIGSKAPSPNRSPKRQNEPQMHSPLPTRPEDHSTTRTADRQPALAPPRSRKEPPPSPNLPCLH
jgi:hypothetical protein